MNKTMKSWLMLAAAACFIAGLSGCQMISYALMRLEPPKKVDAQYKPPAGKKVLVFVDDVAHPVNYEPIKRELAEQLGSQLVEHKLAASTIPYERVMGMMAADTKFNDVSINGVVEIGRKLGADLVLYVEIKGFKLKEDERSPLWEGRLETAVRWVDCSAAKSDEARLWPKDMPASSGFEVKAVTAPVKEDPSLAYGQELAKDLAEKMAVRIGRLFYDYEVKKDEVEE